MLSETGFSCAGERFSMIETATWKTLQRKVCQRLSGVESVAVI